MTVCLRPIAGVAGERRALLTGRIWRRNPSGLVRMSIVTPHARLSQWLLSRRMQPEAVGLGIWQTLATQARSDLQEFTPRTRCVCRKVREARHPQGTPPSREDSSAYLTVGARFSRHTAEGRQVAGRGLGGPACQSVHEMLMRLLSRPLAAVHRGQDEQRGVLSEAH